MSLIKINLRLFRPIVAFSRVSGENLAHQSDVCASGVRMGVRGLDYDRVRAAGGVCRIIAYPASGDCAGRAARRAWPIRLLRVVAVLVTIVLCDRGRARAGPRRKCAVRGSALFVRGARLVATI